MADKLDFSDTTLRDIRQFAIGEAVKIIQCSAPGALNVDQRQQHALLVAKAFEDFILKPKA